MTQINLLPWREKKREQEKKLFTTMLLAAALGAAILVILVNAYVLTLISKQKDRNQLLQKEISTLDQQIKEINTIKQNKKSLIAKMTIVQNIQSGRVLMVHMFDELTKVVPAGVYVTKLERNKDVITLWGYSESNTNISLLMNNIDKNKWIHNPVLAEIKKKDAEKQPE